MALKGKRSDLIYNILQGVMKTTKGNISDFLRECIQNGEMVAIKMTTTSRGGISLQDFNTCVTGLQSRAKFKGHDRLLGVTTAKAANIPVIRSAPQMTTIGISSGFAEALMEFSGASSKQAGLN